MKLNGQSRLAAKFLLARRAKNLTQTFVAKEIGIDQSHYQRIESGKLNIKTDKLILLCDLLDIKMEELSYTCIEAAKDIHSGSFLNANHIKEIKQLAEIEIAKRDQIIYKLKRQIKALTLQF
jgi:transcriptional regulator with XRE-family HTH domain